MLKKKEFIDLLAQKGYTKADAETITKDVTGTVMEILAAGGDVMFHGFGTFSVQDRKPRMSLHPQTKEPIEIPGCKCPKFTPGKLLKRAVKEGYLRKD